MDRATRAGDRHGDTVRRRYGEAVKERDANLLLPRHFAAPPRPRFSTSPSLRLSASPRHLVPASPLRLATASSRQAQSLSSVLILSICCLILLPLTNCGYHFAGTGGQAPGGIQSIAVEVLKNRTAEIGIETTFTNALLNQFIRWKRLQVKPVSQADAVLGGSIASIRVQEFSHLSSTQTLQSRVTVTLALTLKRVETDEILWQNKNLSYYQEYVETGNALDTNTLRREAISTIAVFLAEKVHQDMFEGF